MAGKADGGKANGKKGRRLERSMASRPTTRRANGEKSRRREGQWQKKPTARKADGRKDKRKKDSPGAVLFLFGFSAFYGGFYSVFRLHSREICCRSSDMRSSSSGDWTSPCTSFRTWDRGTCMSAARSTATRSCSSISPVSPR